MSDRELESFKKNMVTLFTIFKNKPNLLVKYILKYDIISDDIKEVIINNKELNKRSKEMELNEEDDLDLPYFSNVKDMKKYYDSIFKTKEDLDDINYPMLNEPKKETLLKDLKEAIKNEDYEKCAKIRDYCIKKDIIIKL
jgi:hypothetical protein